MEILIIIVGVLAIIGMIAFLVSLFIKAINRDQEDQDERILYLEKRINDIKKELTWQIQWETKLRQDLEKEIKDDLTRTKKQIKKKSDSNGMG